MKTEPKAFLSIAVIFSIIALIFSTVVCFQLSRDIDAYIDLAQLAADREDMLEYMKQEIGSVGERNNTLINCLDCRLPVMHHIGKRCIGCNEAHEKQLARTRDMYLEYRKQLRLAHGLEGEE